MAEVAVVLAVAFVLLLLLGTPVAVAIALSTALAILSSGGAPNFAIAAKMANGIDSFALLAIPFFILSGHLMGRGGMARRLIDFAAALVGRFPGGLAHVNVLTCMLFGSISGSAAAAVSSIGGFMIPEMNRKGYNREFNAAVTITAATTGLLIPPSNTFIVYAVATGSVSIAALFMAGVFPGILVGLGLMAVCAVLARRRGYPRGERVPLRAVLAALRRAVLTLLLIVIVIGGILAGVFTPTEAAAIAVVYSLILAGPVYREVKLAELPEMLKQTGITTAVVMLLIGASQGMAWLMTTQNIPQAASAAMLRLSSSPLVVLLLANLLLLLVGTFMDMTPAVLIFTPILLPVVQALGVDPVHFGIIMTANLCIGLCTPPVGTCLFIGCGIARTTIAEVTRPLLPFFGAMVASLMVISFWPALSLWLPRVLGLL